MLHQGQICRSPLPVFCSLLPQNLLIFVAWSLQPLLSTCSPQRFFCGRACKSYKLSLKSLFVLLMHLLSLNSCHPLHSLWVSIALRSPSMKRMSGRVKRLPQECRSNIHSENSIILNVTSSLYLKMFRFFLLALLMKFSFRFSVNT